MNDELFIYIILLELLYLFIYLFRSKPDCYIRIMERNLSWFKHLGF